MSANEIPDELWRKILEIGVKSSTFSYKDLCRISIASRRLCELSSDDSLWLLLLVIDFPNHNDSSSSSSSQSPTKFIYRFERDKERKVAAQRRVLMRKESEISDLLKRYRELDIHLSKEVKKFEAASLEFSNLQRVREASVALKVWQPEVVRGSHKQMVEQNAVPVKFRLSALEMEMKLCRQQIMGIKQGRREITRKIDKASKEINSIKYHPLRGYKSMRSGDQVSSAKRKELNTSIIFPAKNPAKHRNKGKLLHSESD